MNNEEIDWIYNHILDIYVVVYDNIERILTIWYDNNNKFKEFIFVTLPAGKKYLELINGIVENDIF